MMVMRALDEGKLNDFIAVKFLLNLLLLLVPQIVHLKLELMAGVARVVRDQVVRARAGAHLVAAYQRGGPLSETRLGGGCRCFLTADAQAVLWVQQGRDHLSHNCIDPSNRSKPT